MPAAIPLFPSALLSLTSGAMRMIGTISDERAARRFSDALIVQGIANELEPHDAGAWAVWGEVR